MRERERGGVFPTVSVWLRIVHCTTKFKFAKQGKVRLSSRRAFHVHRQLAQIRENGKVDKRQVQCISSSPTILR